jgi:putative drug exporter of the RND superfamily
MSVSSAFGVHRPVLDPVAMPRPGLLGRVAAVSFRHRWLTLGGWLVAVVLAVIVSGAVGGEFTADYTAQGSDSAKAQTLLQKGFPAAAGDSIDIAVRADDGITAGRSRITALLKKIDAVPHVASVDDPFAVKGSISADGRVLLTHARLDVVDSADMPLADAEKIVAVVDAAQRDGFEVAVSGQSILQTEAGGGIGSEGLGLLAAAVVLLLAFGSVVAAGLPILTAVLGLGVSASLVTVIAAFMGVPDWATSLASMMGIGVGIDYVLLLVSRFRENLGVGRNPLQAVIATTETAGRSVLVAGTTVVISLLGLFAMGLSYMRGAAVVTIVAVLVVMLASITAVPALLGLVGHRVNALRIPGTPRSAVAKRGLAHRWSRSVQRRPVLAAVAGTGILVALAMPLATLHFGFPDSGNSPVGNQDRRTYDIAAQAFGKGSNGPLVLAARLPVNGETKSLDGLRTSLRSTPGVASVSPVSVSPDGSTALLTVVPTTGPQDSATDDLVQRLRDDVIPAAAGSGAPEVHVGGVTATAIDSTQDVAKRLPLLMIGVVGLSMLVLLTAFRSVIVAVKAAVMNLLSIAAAYGIVAAVLQGGWLGQLFGIDQKTPLPAFVPVLMFAILFGLSMDYEVFLVSRMREIWLRTGDNARAVSDGLAGTGRIITAAAAIMIAVFGAFVPSPSITLKVIGIGLASAILIDATVVRLLLVPAVMQILGRANWWLPRSVDRRLPDLNIEGRPEFQVPEQTEPLGSSPWAGSSPSIGTAQSIRRRDIARN